MMIRPVRGQAPAPCPHHPVRACKKKRVIHLYDALHFAERPRFELGPICIGMDYNANINWIVAGQPRDRRLNGFDKDKSGEKLAESEEDLIEHRTDGTDAFDTLYIGAEKFPYRDAFNLSMSGVL